MFIFIFIQYFIFLCSSDLCDLNAGNFISIGALFIEYYSSPILYTTAAIQLQTWMEGDVALAINHTTTDAELMKESQTSLKKNCCDPKRKEVCVTYT